MIDHFTTLAICLLVGVMPLGVGAQNIALGIALLCFCWSLRGAESRAALRRSGSILFVPSSLAAAWLIAMSISTIKSEYGSVEAVCDFVSGQLLIVLLPLMTVNLRLTEIGRCRSELHDQRATKAARVGLGVIWVLLFVCLSQRLYGWAWINNALTVGTKFRSQGFHSHPLTLAYASGLVFPLLLAASEKGVTRFCQAMGYATLAMAAVLLMSESRTVIAVALPIGIGFVVTGKFRPRLKVAVLGGITLVVLAASIIPNPLRTKFFETLAQFVRANDGAYFFDREIFWDAHLSAFMEKPLMGWGTVWPDELINQIYENIGQGALAKKYNAHNQYIQFLVEGGVVGASLFGAWVCWYLVEIWRDRPQMRLSRGVLFAIVGSALAALTQNSFYDSEVRYVFVMVICIWLYLRDYSTTAKV